MEFKLEKLKDGMQQRLSREFLHRNIRFDAIEDFLTNDIVIRVEKEFFGHRRNDIVKVEFYTPKSWWQHLKEDCFPKFILNKLPVKYKKTIKKVELNRTWDFPDIPNIEQTVNFIVRDSHRII